MKNITKIDRFEIIKSKKGQSKMDNPDKLATQSAPDEDKQNKNTTQYVLDTTMRKQIQFQ